MIYLAIRSDKPNADSLRDLLKEEHRIFLRSLGTKLLTGGAIFDEVGNIIGGSIVFEAESLSDAKMICNNDPYAKHPDIALNTQVTPYRVRWKDGVFYEGEGYLPSQENKI